MAEGEIYRKSGEKESIGSISGDPAEEVKPLDKASIVDFQGIDEKANQFDAVAAKESTELIAKQLIQSKARFLVSEGLASRPFANRIRKLRQAIASVMERLGHTNE